MARQPEIFASEPIAIVGSSCRLPGGATSPSRLWDLLETPRDVVQKIPASRFNTEQFYHADSQHHGVSSRPAPLDMYVTNCLTKSPEYQRQGCLPP